MFIFCWMFHPQNWMAYEQYPSAWKAKESTVIVFSENELPAAESSYALCKVSMHTSNAWWYRHFLLKLRLLVEMQVWIGERCLTFYLFQFFLQNVPFTSPFYSPPVILTTVLDGGSNNANIACPVAGPLSSWLEVQHTLTSYFNLRSCCIKTPLLYNEIESSNVHYQ